MTAKEYLQQLKNADMTIRQKIKELEDLRAMSLCTGGFDYKNERVQTSLSGDALYEKKVMEIISDEKELRRAIKGYESTRRMIISQIRGLKNKKHAIFLYKRYVEFKKIWEIANEMGYTYQYARELHGAALKNFESSYTNLHSYVLL